MTPTGEARKHSFFGVPPERREGKKKAPQQPNNSVLWEGESECTGQAGLFFRECEPSRVSPALRLSKTEGKRMDRSVRTRSGFH